MHTPTSTAITLCELYNAICSSKLHYIIMLMCWTLSDLQQSNIIRHIRHFGTLDVHDHWTWVGFFFMLWMLQHINMSRRLTNMRISKCMLYYVPCTPLFVWWSKHTHTRTHVYLYLCSHIHRCLISLTPSRSVCAMQCIMYLGLHARRQTCLSFRMT